jgi:hypothetical protein
MNFSFSEWILGYHEAFSRIFLSHDGILAITKPSHELFFFTMESRLSRSLSNDKIHKMRELGETLFIYITKSIFTGPASLKTLPLDLEPPLQGKSTFLLILRKLREGKCFVPETTYRFVVWLLFL